MLSLRDVSLAFQVGPERVVALEAVDLAVAQGELVAVMGPSGSGKTTLVNVAAGLERPHRGTISIDGLDVGRARNGPRVKLRRRRIGVVHQEDELDPVLTAVENVALPLVLDGAGRRVAEELAFEALDRCAAAPLAGRRRDQLSGGERQRVAVARAVVGQRDLVLADEPTAALDSATVRRLVELLAGLAASGSAVLMTTHDARLATFADRVVLLRDGRLVDPARLDPEPVEQLRR